MDDVTFERELLSRAARLSYPATPQLRARVVSVLASGPARPGRRHRQLVLAAAAATVALAIAMALALPASRSAIADLFGVQGSKIERLPTPAPAVTPTQLPPPQELGQYARPSTLDEAATALGFSPAVPSRSETPDVYLAHYPASGRGPAASAVILHYRELDLWETRPYDVNFGKGLPAQVVKRDTTVNGVPAYWLEGGPHIAYLIDDLGIVPGTERTVAVNTLIWNTGHALYRIETPLSQADALAIAITLP